MAKKKAKPGKKRGAVHSKHGLAALLFSRLPYARGQISQVDLLAPNSQEVTCPVNGRIAQLRTIVQKAPTTGGTITVKVGTVAVVGLSVTIANGAAKGTMGSSTVGEIATARVAKGNRIEIVPAGFATAGEVNWQLEFIPDEPDSRP